MSFKGVYKIAGETFLIETIFEYTHLTCYDYLSFDKPEFTVSTTKEDIEFERDKARKEAEFEKNPIEEYRDDYLESLAVLRKLSDKLIDKNCILFHASSLCLDGEGYLFTAKSGTGKSTHSYFWRKHFGDRCVMINDDKPVVKIEDGKATVFGSAWQGKHNLGSNTSVEVKNIAILHRGEKNEAKRIDKKKAYGMLLQQTYRPSDPVKLAKVLKLVDLLADSVSLFDIYCTLDPNSAIEIYNAMKGQN